MWHTTETIPLIFSFKVCHIFSTCKLPLKDGLRKPALSIWLRGLRVGGHTNGQKEFKQCCAQCDYLSFFHGGCSFRGHHHCILSISHTPHTHTHTKQVGLCHFNDSIAFGVLYRLCSVTLQRPMWRAPTPPLWIRPHSDGSRCGRLLPLARRGC